MYNDVQEGSEGLGRYLTLSLEITNLDSTQKRVNFNHFTLPHHPTQSLRKKREDLSARIYFALKSNIFKLIARIRLTDKILDL